MPKFHPSKPTILRKLLIMPRGSWIYSLQTVYQSMSLSFILSWSDQKPFLRDRVCIKIPSTVEALIACSHLSKMGIQTLGTCIFSLPQALAASQAGCIHITPYLNGMRMFFAAVHNSHQQ